MTNDLLRLHRVLDVLGDAGALHGVVGQQPVEDAPAVVLQRGVGGRRRDDREHGLVEDRVGVLRLTGEGRADDADDRRVADDAAGQLRGLVGRALRVELLQLDLAVRVGRVELVDGELGAVVDRDAEARVLAGVGAEEGEGQAAALDAGRHLDGRAAAGGGRGGGAARAAVVAAPPAAVVAGAAVVAPLELLLLSLPHAAPTKARPSRTTPAVASLVFCMCWVSPSHGRRRPGFWKGATLGVHLHVEQGFVPARAPIVTNDSRSRNRRCIGFRG